MKKTTLGLTAAAVAVLVAVLFRPLAEEVRERRLPPPTAAWVAVEAEGSGIAVVGPSRLPAGTDFTLHAVLEARGPDGERVFFTRAPGVGIDGERFTGDAVRRWEGDLAARVLWFTVEHPSPALRVGEESEAIGLRYTEHFRPEWPQAWSIPGRLEPKYRTEAATEDRWAGAGEAFGTQRYHVRIELFGPESAIRPRDRYASPDASALEGSPEAVTSVTVHLPGRLALASEVFGLPVLHGPGLGRLAEEAGDLWRRRLAFSRARLVAALLAERGTSVSELRWQDVDLAAADVRWGDGGAGTGDLLQVGERVVVLARDEGIAGRLDHGDLAFDYEGGAAVRALGEVFGGEGLVEWVRAQKEEG